MIVDNSPAAYMFHPECALPILSWFDDMNDRVLYEWLPMLEALSRVDDVRHYIRRFCYDNSVDLFKAHEVLSRA